MSDFSGAEGKGGAEDEEDDDEEEDEEAGGGDEEEEEGDSGEGTEEEDEEEDEEHDSDFEELDEEHEGKQKKSCSEKQVCVCVYTIYAYLRFAMCAHCCAGLISGSHPPPPAPLCPRLQLLCASV